jgi:hypothetical protein
MSCLQKFLADRMFESSPPNVNHLSNDGYGDFFRQNRADIQPDGHVYALETLA